MPIQFARLVQKTYTDPNGTFHLYRMRCHGGQWSSAVYIGPNPPKALKTVEYQLHGKWENHPRYGRQFRIEEYKRSERSDLSDEGELVRRANKKLT